MLKILFINLLLPTALISTPVIAASGIFVATDNNPIKVEEKIILEEPKPFNKEKIEKNLSDLKKGLKSGLEKFFSWFNPLVIIGPAPVDDSSPVITPVLPEPDVKVSEEKDAEVKKIPKPEIVSVKKPESKPKEVPKIDSITNDIDVKPNKRFDVLHWTDLTVEGQDIVSGVYKDFNDYGYWWDHWITDTKGKWVQNDEDYVEYKKWNWPEQDGHKIILIPETQSGRTLKLRNNTNSEFKTNKVDFAKHQDQTWTLYFRWPYTTSYYEDRLWIGYNKQIQKTIENQT